MTNLYLDCEWFTNQKIFLFGYAYSIANHGQLYDHTLTLKNLVKILKPVDGYLFFYGPDIAMLEKYFHLEIRNHCKCVNLLRVFKAYLPGMNSYKLAYLESYYGIERTTYEYKTDIFKMWHDWRNPDLRKLILKYNQEDVLNLIRLKKHIFNKKGISNAMIDKMLLQ